LSNDFVNHLTEKTEDIYPEALRLLKGLIAIPSVAAQHREIPTAVAYIRESIEQLGGQTEVLDDLPGNPVIYGYFPAGAGGIPGARCCFITITMFSRKSRLRNGSPLRSN
jgi:acetylornithine deacetylase/succinyl-diaminopimelate desuccinylase-like protein